MNRYAGVDPATKVYGVFECPDCQELRPIFTRHDPVHTRVYRCSRCVDVRDKDRVVYRIGKVTYLEHPMTFRYFQKTFENRFKKQGELF